MITTKQPSDDSDRSRDRVHGARRWPGRRRGGPWAARPRDRALRDGHPRAGPTAAPPARSAGQRAATAERREPDGRGAPRRRPAPIDAKPTRSHASTSAQRRSAQPEACEDPMPTEPPSSSPWSEAYRELRTRVRSWPAPAEMRDDRSRTREMRDIARDEVERLEAQEARPWRQLQGAAAAARSRTTTATSSSRSGPGAGGEEAALFAAELLPDVPPLRRAAPLQDGAVTSSETGIGGVKEVISRSTARAPTVGSSSRAACIACSACRRPSRAAASTPPRRRWRCCPRRTRWTSHRRGQGPPHRRQALVRAGWPAREHHRLRGAHHPPPDRPRGRDPGREEPAQEQGKGDGRAARAAAGAGAAQGARGGAGGAPLHGRLRRALREDPHLQLSRRTG